MQNLIALCLTTTHVMNSHVSHFLQAFLTCSRAAFRTDAPKLLRLEIFDFLACLRLFPFSLSHSNTVPSD